jgi:hypothetical protein
LKVPKSKRAHTQEKVEREDRDEAAAHGVGSISGRFRTHALLPASHLVRALSNRPLFHTPIT